MHDALAAHDRDEPGSSWRQCWRRRASPRTSSPCFPGPPCQNASQYGHTRRRAETKQFGRYGVGGLPLRPRKLPPVLKLETTYAALSQHVFLFPASMCFFTLAFSFSFVPLPLLFSSSVFSFRCSSPCSSRYRGCTLSVTPQGCLSCTCHEGSFIRTREGHGRERQKCSVSSVLGPPRARGSMSHLLLTESPLSDVPAMAVSSAAISETDAKGCLCSVFAFKKKAPVHDHRACSTNMTNEISAIVNAQRCFRNCTLKDPGLRTKPLSQKGCWRNIHHTKCPNLQYVSTRREKVLHWSPSQPKGERLQIPMMMMTLKEVRPTVVRGLALQA